MDDPSIESGLEDLDAEGSEPKEFEPARFACELGLAVADDGLRVEAADAVRKEHQDCSKWKRLQCRKVSLFSERDRGTVFIVDVGRSIEFDWTWEGAIATRPASLDANRLFADHSYEHAEYEDDVIWQGEVLEVDERNGCLFIRMENVRKPPNLGPFFVQPYEFLADLDTIFHQEAFEPAQIELPRRLAAARGDVTSRIERPIEHGLPELRDWWKHSWSILWGPPGTGKTYTTGQQVAAVLDDASEQFLFVPTTNRATDAAAISIGNAARVTHGSRLDDGQLVRVGKGASLQTFEDAGLETMLRSNESDVLRQLEQLKQQHRIQDEFDDKALTRKHIGELINTVNDDSMRCMLSKDVRVVVATAFKAMRSLKRLGQDTKYLENRAAPFTTIFIDEAGLMSLAAIAALSLLAARRVVLVGDSKQLAPISRISRVLPLRQQRWLASSGLSHLDEMDGTPDSVHVLSEQRRMHPDVCDVVSDFQYGGFLKTADETRRRDSCLSPFIADHSRAIWYVLDEENVPLEFTRAKRGPGQRSWVRSITPTILKKLFADRATAEADGLFVSPYKAQAQVISKLLGQWGHATWEASTVHSQQGVEADVVIFDTVNAGSYNWPFEEWKRLVNVALSRAREAVIVLASRSEMGEPYLKPLLKHLTPSILVAADDADSGGFRWVTEFNRGIGFQPVDNTRKADRLEAYPTTYLAVAEDRAKYTTGERMGDQFAQRKTMSTVLSQEQQRLANMKLDGRPRLVRGVAGSGKSVVLSHWLAKTIKNADPETRVWAVYANRSLHRMLSESIESAWDALTRGDLFDAGPFPWHRVELRHVKDVLADLLSTVQLSIDSFNFDYDLAATTFLNRQDAEEIVPRCSALFIDEAQDMGPSTLRLLLSMVDQTDQADHNSRAAHVFYDNAQNIYGCQPPKWSEFGLDMRGRSSMMRENFRSTKPIAELAVNILRQLTHKDQRHDQAELLKLGLVALVERGGAEWLDVRFNEIHGPRPIFRHYESRVAEVIGIAGHIRHLVQKDGISPADMCVIYNGRSVLQTLESQLRPKLAEFGVELSVQRNRSFERRPNTLVVTTSHSYKGYESEVVLIPAVDQFVTGEGQVLAKNLYVAMTRARSLLARYGVVGGSESSRRITDVVQGCVHLLGESS